MIRNIPILITMLIAFQLHSGGVFTMTLAKWPARTNDLPVFGGSVWWMEIL